MIEAFLSACAGWVVVYPLGFIRFKRKPFSCEVCMAGWFCLLLSIGYYTWYMILFYMCAAMVFAAIITKLINRL